LGMGSSHCNETCHIPTDVNLPTAYGMNHVDADIVERASLEQLGEHRMSSLLELFENLNRNPTTETFGSNRDI